MRFSSMVFLGLILASGLASADDQTQKKAKPAARSDKNVFQKAESSVGDWANRNKVWVTRKKKAEKKKD